MNEINIKILEIQETGEIKKVIYPHQFMLRLKLSDKNRVMVSASFHVMFS